MTGGTALPNCPVIVGSRRILAKINEVIKCWIETVWLAISSVPVLYLSQDLRQRVPYQITVGHTLRADKGP